MEEITTIYILKTFKESINNEELILNNKVILVDNDYLMSLVKILGITEEMALKTFKNVIKKLKIKFFLLNYETIILDLENCKFNPTILRQLVKNIIEKVIIIKIDYAYKQTYEKAGKFRDIEMTLKQIYFI